jgi:hypothetical protein
MTSSDQKKFGSSPVAKSDTASITPGHRELQEEVSVLADQLAALEREYKGSNGLMNTLGRAFGFGAAGKLEWTQFKLRYKRGQLEEFESQHLAKAA